MVVLDRKLVVILVSFAVLCVSCARDRLPVDPPRDGFIVDDAEVTVTISEEGLERRGLGIVSSTGRSGGPFLPEKRRLHLLNDTARAVEVSLDASSTLLELGQPQRQIDPGSSAFVEVHFDSEEARRLEAGEYRGSLVLTIIEEEVSLEIPWTLEVEGPLVLPDLAPSPTPDVTPLEPEPRRVEEGLLALYEFDEGSGDIVADTSNHGEPLNLVIEDPQQVSWAAAGLVVDGETRIRSTASAVKVNEAIRDSSELSVEVWITPADIDQNGPARILSLAGVNSSHARNFMLGQGVFLRGSDQFSVRCNTSDNDEDGGPDFVSGRGTLLVAPSHVVVTRDVAGVSVIYRDGVAIARGSFEGDLSTWRPSDVLTLANEVDADRPWRGTFSLVAIYGRALSTDEVYSNFEAGVAGVRGGRLIVDPASGIELSGVEGDVQGTARSYVLRNAGEVTLDWSLEVDRDWVRLSDSGGSLEAGESVEVVAMLEGERLSGYGPGQLRAEMSFSNTSGGQAPVVLPVTVTILAEGQQGKPGPHNTGPTAPGALTPWVGSNTISTPGIVIEDKIFSGTVRIEADDVTIRNFIIDGGDSLYGLRASSGYSGGLFEDGEIRNVSSAAVFGGGITLRRLNLHESGGDGMKLRSDSVAQGCWIHHLGKNDGAHADGNQTRVGSNITIRGCNFDLPVPESSAGPDQPYKSNAASINQAELGDIENLVMEGNWLNGGNYTVYFTARDDSGYRLRNCALVDNHFGRDFRFGVLSVQTSHVDGLVVRGNRWEDTGELMSINQ